MALSQRSVTPPSGVDEPTVRYRGRFVRTDLTDPIGTPPAEAMLVRGGTILDIGLDDEVPAGSKNVEIHEGWVIPGLIEPHGHPGEASLLLSKLVIDIRPVETTSADEVMRRLRSSIDAKPDAVLANGWDPLLQVGLVTPTTSDLDALAGDVPLVIVHNSGHSAYFNSAAARSAGVSRDTPDPAGASFSRDAQGDLTGTAQEAAAVMRITMPAMEAAQAELPQIFAEHLADLRRRGITTVADLSWDHALNPLVAGLRSTLGELPVRLRTYEMSRPGGAASVPRDNGDSWVRQVGIKTWSDGSPWVGNIATSFPYLDTVQTRALGLDPGHRGTANYSTEELRDIGAGYAADGWQLACHAHGDLAIDSTLDAYESIITQLNLSDHRFRLEHLGAMNRAQMQRALELGVTVSFFVDHITYWGDALIDDLFGYEHGAAWTDAGAAFELGHRATFHNDGWVTPVEPLRNMAVAETRTSRTGRHLGNGTPVRRMDALRAHTSHAAWQLHSEHEVGALSPGLYADFTVLDVDPRTTDPESLATARVLGSAVNGECEWNSVS